MDRILFDKGIAEQPSPDEVAAETMPAGKNPYAPKKGDSAANRNVASSLCCTPSLTTSFDN
jgi:hypothetical protein